METPTHKEFNGWDALKIWGLLLVAIDHIGGYLLPPDHPLQTILRSVGRGAAPIFLFLTGYATSHKIKFPLVLEAVALQASLLILLPPEKTASPLNILFTILFGRLLLQTLPQKFLLNHLWELSGAFLLLAPLTETLFDYGTLAFLPMLSAIACKNPTAPKNIRWLPSTTFAIYTITQCVGPHPSQYILITILSMSLTYTLLQILPNAQLPTLPKPLAQWLKPISQHSGILYALHIPLLLLLKPYIYPP